MRQDNQLPFPLFLKPQFTPEKEKLHCRQQFNANQKLLFQKYSPQFPHTRVHMAYIKGLSKNKTNTNIQHHDCSVYTQLHKVECM